MENLVGPIIEIVKFVGRPIVRYLKHQIKFNSHLEQFNGREDRLCNRKRDIELRLKEELCYGKIAKEEVQSWLNDVETYTRRPKVVEEANSWGCLSCCCRVKILDKRDQELEEIFNRGGGFTTGCLVNDDPSVSVVELPTEELQGSVDIKAEILTSLMGDEVTKLAVWGMGGIGKTTIMQHVYNVLLKEGKFKKVIWATVSQTFDVKNLQEQIACSLKEQLLEHQNTITRGATLSQMLERQKPYLLILDDVWSSFKLTTVGIPEPLLSDSSKLVLTTRSREVAHEMGCEIVTMKTLSKKDALELFIDKVGDIVLTDQGCIKGTLESTLKEIVDECDGLPLAIVTVAGSLKGISEPRLWNAALNQLKDCKRNVAATDDGDAFGVLKFSYNRLKPSKIQHCFLCCALCPEDYNIPIDSIIDYWIDEGLIDEMGTLEAMKNEGHDILWKLVENCLLESIKDRLQGDCVRMHDLVRDMALQITRMSPRFMVEAGKALTELPEKEKWTGELEKVSLMRNKIKEIPSSILSSKCTMLTTLLLSSNNLSTISESVFEHLPALKILDLSYNKQLSSLPSSISKLVNLTTLLLQQCRSLTEVPSLSELRDLKKLNLNWTGIKEVPQSLEMCTNLKYLSLEMGRRQNCFSLMGSCDILHDAILLNLSKLQQLFVDPSIALRGEVIGRLKKLEAFNGRFSTVHEWSIFLKCFHGQRDGLKSYSLTIGNEILWSLSRQYAKQMTFNGIDTVGETIILPSSINGLQIEYCHNIRSLNDLSSIKDATDLRQCDIGDCRGMEYVFSSWINPLLQTLEELILAGLDKLEGLFEAKAIALPLPPGTFSSLKSITIEGCGKIKKLISSWKLLGYLQSLERIDVWGGEEMEEIIASDPEEEGEGGDIIKKLILPKLKYLALISLPALKSICSTRAVMVCDSLERICICSCKGLRRIPVYLPLADNAQPSPPPSLKEITAFPREWWESLEWDHPNAKDVLRPLLR